MVLLAVVFAEVGAAAAVAHVEVPELKVSQLLAVAQAKGPAPAANLDL